MAVIIAVIIAVIAVVIVTNRTPIIVAIGIMLETRGAGTLCGLKLGSFTAKGGDEQR
jgi:hypothetical protein